MGDVVDLPRSLPATVEHVTDTMVSQALAMCEGNRTKAAKLLGMKRTTLCELIKRRPVKETTDRIVLIRVLGPQPKRVKIEIED